MLESRWPKGPLLILVALIPALLLLNPWIRAAVDGSRPSGLSESAPQLQGPYVTKWLDRMAATDLKRVAGRDLNLPPALNGHDEFGDAWVRLMRSNLYGLHPGTFVQTMPVPGFRGGERAKTAGKNLIIFVRGVVHPKRAIIVGAHYDGEPDSRGSAYDDASGAAIMVGLARSLGSYWRSNGLPNVTVEFCLFDAEEQGMIGSGAYLHYLRLGATMPRPMMMIDEEQSGVGYPDRPFGQAGGPILPMYAVTTVQSRTIKRLFGPLTQPRAQALALIRSRLEVDRAAAFSVLQPQYPTIQVSGQPVESFGQSEAKHVIVGPTPVCCSDNGPFEALGLPTVTFAGDFQFYNRSHPDWAYPFDQPSDTPAALACDTGGAAVPSSSLEAALTLPLVMSFDLINDYAPVHADGSVNSLAVLGTTATANSVTRMSVAGPGPITWSFGDRSTATGSNTSHRYTKPGYYVIHVSSPTARATVVVRVRASSNPYRPWSDLPRPPPARRWNPPELRGIAGCP